MSRLVVREQMTQVSVLIQDVVQQESDELGPLGSGPGLQGRTVRSNDDGDTEPGRNGNRFGRKLDLMRVRSSPCLDANVEYTRGRVLPCAPCRGRQRSNKAREPPNDGIRRRRSITGQLQAGGVIPSSAAVIQDDEIISERIQQGTKRGSGSKLEVDIQQQGVR
jgi:hypothetical protein